MFTLSNFHDRLKIKREQSSKLSCNNRWLCLRGLECSAPKAGEYLQNIHHYEQPPLIECMLFDLKPSLPTCFAIIVR